VVLEEAPVQWVDQIDVERPHQVLTLSAKTDSVLKALTEKYIQYLHHAPAEEIPNIAFTVNTGRSHHRHRLAVVAASLEDFRDKLQAYVNGQTEIPGLITGEVKDNAQFKIAFLFPGQGSQYMRMGQELYVTQPLFKKILNHCAQVLDLYLDRPLLEIFLTPEKDSLFDQTLYTQPALFALEYSLAQLWMSWGIQPAVLMGHSVGEYVAACLAGVFSLEDSLKLIAERVRLMQALSSDGAMVSALTDPDTVQAAIAGYPDQVSIAAYNGPENVVFSGERQAVEAIARDLEAKGIKVKPLEVSQAFHSPMMDPMLSEFRQVAQQIQFSTPRIPIVSNVTGETVGQEISTPEYWVKHVRQPVKFAQGIQTLQQQEVGIHLEVGPKPILLGMGRQCVAEDEGIWLPSLRQGQSDWETMLTSLAQLYVSGVDIDWVGFDKDYPRRKISGLPTYPFQRQRYWVEPIAETPRESSQGQTDIVNLLSYGSTQELWHRVSKANDFSDEQLQTVTRVLEILIHQHQQQMQTQANIAQDYYNAVAALSSGFAHSEGSQSFEESFLTFGPLPEVIPDFSWIKVFSNPESYPEYMNLIRRVQKEMRQILFSHVDFSGCQSVLDFGCGYASDLIALAEQYPHLQPLHGYTISGQQAQVGMEKVQAHQLHERVQIFNCDSATADYPDHYDLVFGFEVAHHILNKKALFSNIGHHLNEDGYLILADFISNAEFTIEHFESSSFFITKAEWVDHLSQNQLQIVECIDSSHEIANFLDDKHFDEHLDAIYQRTRNDKVKAGFQSYHQLGDLLRRGLASYILLTAKKQSQLSEPELSRWNQQQLHHLVPYALRSPHQWLYQLTWHPLPLLRQAAEAKTLTGQWLIFADQNGIGQQVATQLEAQGHSCLQVYRGDAYEQVNGKAWRIRLTEPHDYQQLCRLTTDLPWRGVVHLWSLDSQPPDELTLSGLQQAQRLGCASVLHLVHALGQLAEQSLPQLWLVTQGCQALAQSQERLLNVQQSPLWGMGKVLALEHPEFNCRLIDLDLDNTPTQVEGLVRELLHPDDENQVAYYQGQRYGARLQQLCYPDTPQVLPIHAMGSYLITGGLGALGLEVAKWLVQQGAHHVVLTSRHAPSEHAQVMVEHLQQRGAQVRVLQGDIAQPEDLHRILETIQNSMPTLKGIIHAAGLVDDGVLRQQSWERFEKVMAPKVAGSWNLHHQTQHLPLDFLVCFSSAASLLGSPGQGNYAAANTFMDTLAHYRSNQQQPTLSLNWGPWAMVGMAAQLASQQQARLSGLGIGDIDLAQGLWILGDLLKTRYRQIGIFAMNWGQFSEQRAVSWATPYFSWVAQQWEARGKGGHREREEAGILEQLQAAPAAERRAMLMKYVGAVVSKILGQSNAIEVVSFKGFNEQGMDSLMALELRNTLQRDLQCPLVSSLAFDYPTVDRLVNYLFQQLGFAQTINALLQPQDIQCVSDHTGSSLTPLETLSDDEARAILLQKLAAMENSINE
jgi:myxalamid-type polyketide synthase MxaE and MxaD